MFEEKYKTIGLNIMYYRRALNLTQSELAEKAEMSRARVSDIECGKGPFNMESIFLLAQAMHAISIIRASARPSNFLRALFELIFRFNVVIACMPSS